MRNISRSELLTELTTTRAQTLALIDSLAPEQWTVPQIEILNPPLWEVGHIAWFQEYWCLRFQPNTALTKSLLPQSDHFYDSSTIAHTNRWIVELPTQVQMRQYLADVLASTLERLARAADTDAGLYFFRLALLHEKMHIEAMTHTWQGLDYVLPFDISVLDPSPLLADLQLAGGELLLGSLPTGGFVFDNEKWGHPVSVAPFEVSSSPVLNSEYLAFVNDNGYSEEQFWDPIYFAALNRERRRMPANWQTVEGRMTQRWFGQSFPVEANRTLAHVSAYEAQAYCKWAKRRLPTEVEWEFAATHDVRFDWGNAVWEWTSTAFEPFAGFSADPYKEYSAPWFGDHRVVKGASFATPRGMSGLKYRNFFRPERNDMFIGFRTCALK